MSVDGGSYFIIREEFLTDSAGSFEIKTKYKKTSGWSLNRKYRQDLFNMRSVWDE
jgi:hypothetical protein